MKACVALVLIGVFCAIEAANNRPIIGVLDQDFVDGSPRTFVAASYVKWVESGGARVVPLFYEKWDSEEMISMLKNLNGVLLPGGGVEMTGKYYAQLQVIFNYAKQLNDNGIYFPIWGSCLGSRELLCLAANDTSIIYSGFDSLDLPLAMELTPAAGQSRLLQAMPADVKTIAVSEKVNINTNPNALALKHFNELPKLVDFFDVLSASDDRTGFTFVTYIEAKKYPFYGTQFHPEKIQFEWNQDTAVDHGSDSVEFNSWLARFFVDECRKNDNHFADTKSEQNALIYQYTPTYTGNSTRFLQSYLFPY